MTLGLLVSAYFCGGFACSAFWQGHTAFGTALTLVAGFCLGRIR
jgi:hypothetical protein